MSKGGVDLNEAAPPVLLFRGDIPGEANVRFLDGDVCQRGSSRSVVKRISERTISRACGLG